MNLKSIGAALAIAATVLAIAGSLLAAGMYIGRNDEHDKAVEQRLNRIEAEQRYLHGDIAVPSRKD